MFSQFLLSFKRKGKENLKKKIFTSINSDKAFRALTSIINHLVQAKIVILNGFYKNYTVYQSKNYLYFYYFYFSKL